MDTLPFDLYIVRNFIDDDTCRALIAEMRSSAASPALTYGKGDALVDEQVRRVRSACVSPKSLEFVTRRLDEQRAAITDHFDVRLTDFEAPQFLSYRVGDFFVAHQDGNTGLINLESDRIRRISVSIFLNNQSADGEPDTYSGGSLVFTDWRRARREVVGERGMLLAFRSETTHEVTPVARGERHAIVSWYIQREFC